MRATACAVGAVLLAGLMPAVAGASERKTYSVVLEQEGTGSGDQVTKAHLTNKAASQNLGAARLRAPEGHAIKSAKVGGRTFFPPADDPRTVTVTELGLTPGSTTTIEMQVNNPSDSCGVFPWGSDARQSNNFNGNPGNKFTLDEAASRLITVVTGCGIEWGNQPADAEINQNIRALTGEDQGHFDPDGPPLLVFAEDGVPISVQLHKLVGDGQLSGTQPQASVGGAASFEDLKVDHGGTYQLIASDGVQEVRSEVFLIEDGAVDCSVEECTVTVMRMGGTSGLGILAATAVTMTVSSEFNQVTTQDRFLRAALIPREDIFVAPFETGSSDGTGCDAYEEQSPFYGRFDGVAGKSVTITVLGAASELRGCYFDPVPFIPAADNSRFVHADTDGDDSQESFGAIAPDCTSDLVGLANPCVRSASGDEIEMLIPKRELDPGSMP